MGSLFHPTYTLPIPPKAERVTVRGKKCVRVTVKGKKHAFPVTKDGKSYLRPVAMWYGQWLDAKGKQQRKKLSTDKEAARQKLRQFEDRARRQREGLIDPTEEQGKRPLAEHLADFAAVLGAKGDSEKHVSMTVNRIRTVLDGVGAGLAAELDSAKVSAWLTTQRRGDTPILVPDRPTFSPAEAAAVLGISVRSVARAVQVNNLTYTGRSRARRMSRDALMKLAAVAAEGFGPATQNHYVRALRGLFNWMVKDKRIPYNPVAGIGLVNESVDVRHARRELTEDELGLIFDTTRVSGRTFRGLDGEDRHAVYLLAITTGFRVAAIAKLKVENFDFPARRVTIGARSNKSRKVKVQPLTEHAAEILAAYLSARRLKGGPIWPGGWANDAADMLKADLAAAGIPYVVEGRDGTPLHADFHALRHSFITIGGRRGINLQTLQKLAGHSTPVLTAKYLHVSDEDLARGVDLLNGIGTRRKAGAENLVQNLVQDGRIPLQTPAPICTTDRTAA